MQIYAHHKFIWRALEGVAYSERAPRPKTCAPAPVRTPVLLFSTQNFQPPGAAKLYGNRRGQIWDRIYFVHYCNYVNWRIAHTCRACSGKRRELSQSVNFQTHAKLFQSAFLAGE
jgi:hypothetical protein